MVTGGRVWSIKLQAPLLTSVIERESLFNTSDSIRCLDHDASSTVNHIGAMDICGDLVEIIPLTMEDSNALPTDDLRS